MIAAVCMGCGALPPVHWSGCAAWQAAERHRALSAEDQLKRQRDQAEAKVGVQFAEITNLRATVARLEQAINAARVTLSSEDMWLAVQEYFDAESAWYDPHRGLWAVGAIFAEWTERKVDPAGPSTAGSTESASPQHEPRASTSDDPTDWTEIDAAFPRPAWVGDFVRPLDLEDALDGRAAWERYAHRLEAQVRDYASGKVDANITTNYLTALRDRDRLREQLEAVRAACRGPRFWLNYGDGTKVQMVPTADILAILEAK